MTGWGALPQHGQPADQILADIAGLREIDLPTHGGTAVRVRVRPGGGRAR